MPTHHAGPTPPDPLPPGTLLHSIGDVAKATGLSVDTLRVWERRYGGPVPVRLPSGHRRYLDEHVLWLRRVCEAIALGHRPSQVVPIPLDELTRRIENASMPQELGTELRAMLEHVRAYRSNDLRAALSAQLERLGVRAWLPRIVAPLLVAVGREWAEGRLDVRHEHLCSELLEDLLRQQRALLPSRERGPLVLLATLSGEGHGLGLQMAALVCALVGAPHRLLGTQLPSNEIAAAARQMNARAVALSVSLSTGGIDTDRELGELRRKLPPAVQLVIGGAGARGVRRGPRGIDYAPTLDDFERWLRALIASAAAPARASSF